MRQVRAWGAVGGALVLAAALLSAAPSTAARAAAAANDPASTTLRLGPFQVPAAGGPGGHGLLHNRVLAVPKPCEDCFVTGFVPRLVDHAGRRADMRTGVMLHHVAVYEAARPRPECAGDLPVPGRPVLGSGDERAPVILPDGFGLPVHPAPWVALLDLMNESEQPREVFVEIDVHHLPGATPGMKPVTLLVLGMNTCGEATYPVARGRSATTSTWTSTLTGRVVGAFGHVHPGGVGTVLANTSTGRRLCASHAGYGDDASAGMVSAMTPCAWDSLGTVELGQQLAVTSLYDTPIPLPTAMGIMAVLVHETTDLTGGGHAPARLRRTPDTVVPAAVRDHETAPSSHGGHQPGGHPPHADSAPYSPP